MDGSTLLSSGQDIKKCAVFWLNRIFVQHEKQFNTGKAESEQETIFLAQKCPVDNAARPRHQSPISWSINSSPIGSGTRKKVKTLGGKVSKGNRLKRRQSSKFLLRNPTAPRETPRDREEARRQWRRDCSSYAVTCDGDFPDPENWALFHPQVSD